MFEPRKVVDSPANVRQIIRPTSSLSRVRADTTTLHPPPKHTLLSRMEYKRAYKPTYGKMLNLYNKRDQRVVFLLQNSKYYTQTGPGSTKVA